MIGSWIYSEGTGLTTQGCVRVSGAASLKGGGSQITKPFVYQVMEFGFHLQAVSCHLFIFK